MKKRYLSQFVFAMFLVIALTQAIPTASAEFKSRTIVSPIPAAEPTIAKDFVQVTIRTHPQYYRSGQRDQDTWSWTPRISFRVNGPIASGSQLSMEFTLPGSKPWLKFDCDTGEAADAAHWWGVRDCGNNLPDEKAVTETGMVDFNIRLRNELSGTNATLFTGKMKVEKFHYGLDLPKFKNNFVYYVNEDWNLPVGYVYLEGEKDAHSNNINWDFPELKVSLWFRGESTTTNDVVAYLFYQGQEVGSTKTTEKGTNTDEVSNLASQSSQFEWRRKKFFFNTVRGWDKAPQGHIKAHLLSKNPGEYEIKVLQNGHLARTAKFTVTADGKFNNGIAAANKLGSDRVMLPVVVLGDQDGPWDRNAWKTLAFYGNPLVNFNLP